MKKCCLRTVCSFIGEFDENDKIFLFIPYEDELKNKFVAYIASDKYALLDIFSDETNEIIELLSFSQIMHIEPRMNITAERLIEIQNFYSLCQQSPSWFENMAPSENYFQC